jgi:ATP-dependent RNA helicase DeaD/ATP-dependent RNA helicase RhlE
MRQMTKPQHQPPTIVEAPIPAEPRSFAEFGVSSDVVEALALGNINATFPIQALVLRDAISGRDVLARSRTGSGKTLAFAIPIVEQLKHDKASPQALILVPTRELASQVTEAFRTISDVKHLVVASVYGGVGLKEQAQRAAKADIVIATPGRLLDLVRRKMLSLGRVRICVLDEADRMLDMGFLPDVSDILDRIPEDRQTMLFSATLDGEVGRLASRYTDDPVLHEIIEERQVVAEALHRFISVPRDEKVAVLARELAGDRGSTLIFVRTKRGADRLAQKLKEQGFGAQALHGDMSQAARERALARFASGKGDILVATDVAARGLDLEHITHVVNYDAPQDEKAYVHRVGRTARAGRGGTGITLVTPEERGDVSRIVRVLGLEAEFIEAGMKVHPPRTIYSGKRGRGSMLGRRPRRKF